ncbi:cysteine rich repeat-containing protein [Agrobacterium pusense]|uniref:cysteine rich repeat-containing protein n=1 Tax=Agrobacterium pusense TaxID=648995 RepID=UPI0009CBE6EE|nr:hypothetical protein BTE56_22995 [Agrobacterium pusense]
MLTNIAFTCLVATGFPAVAQTLSYAEATSKLAEACGADIQKLCKGLNLGNGRILGCLEQNSAKVSPRCKASFAEVFQSIAKREKAQTSYERTCQRDIASRCSGIKGDGFILSCLVKKEQRVSPECYQVITDAGWR